MRKKIVAGNWKMNLNLNEGFDLAGSVLKMVNAEKSKLPGVILCTPFIHLSGVSRIISNSIIETGAQNCSPVKSGAFTGEISAPMIKSTGATWTIIGHSERRALFCESDELLLRKTNAALEAGLKVIFCCGEVLHERESLKHFSTVESQLADGLFKLEAEQFAQVVIAYEPVWAIGTGVTASPDQAQEMHAFIRKLVAARYGEAIADDTTILYGGSCKGSNAAELFRNKDVDGGLIGGASLNASEFLTIITALKV